MNAKVKEPGISEKAKHAVRMIAKTLKEHGFSGRKKTHESDLQFKSDEVTVTICFHKE